MSNWLLLPGRGGRIASPAQTSAAVMTDADGTAWYLDASRCTGMVLQISLTSGVGGFFQVKQTINGTDFADLGAGVPAVNGAIATFESALRPFGKIEIDCASVTGLDSTHTVSVSIQGQVIGGIVA